MEEIKRNKGCHRFCEARPSGSGAVPVFLRPGGDGQAPSGALLIYTQIAF